MRRLRPWLRRQSHIFSALPMACGEKEKCKRHRRGCAECSPRVRALESVTNAMETMNWWQALLRICRRKKKIRKSGKSMDQFSNSAHQLRMRNVLSVGATFGVFLTIGNAWFVFLQAVVFRIMPSDTPVVINGIYMDEINVLREFVFASLATFICIILLICIVKANQCMEFTERSIPGGLSHIRKNISIRVVRPRPS